MIDTVEKLGGDSINKLGINHLFLRAFLKKSSGHCFISKISLER